VSYCKPYLTTKLLWINAPESLALLTVVVVAVAAAAAAAVYHSKRDALWALELLLLRQNYTLRVLRDKPSVGVG